MTDNVEDYVEVGERLDQLDNAFRDPHTQEAERKEQWEELIFIADSLYEAMERIVALKERWAESRVFEVRYCADQIHKALVGEMEQTDD